MVIEMAIKMQGRGTCVAQSVKHPTLGFGSGCDLRVVGSSGMEPRIKLHTQQGVQLSLSLCPSPCSLSLK